MRDLRIERTLWQLKVPGRIEIPAATAFERMIWQDKRGCGGGLEDRGLDERSDAAEFVKDTRLEEDGAGDHDGLQPATRTGRCRPTTDIWTRAKAAQRPLRGPGARQTAHISGDPLRGQSVDLQGKCRRFQPKEQWKRFAFSNRGMEAYFRMGRLRNGFLLCRCLSARSEVRHALSRDVARATCLSVKPAYCYSKNDIREATGDKAFDRSGSSSGNDRNEWCNCPGLSDKTRHDHRSLCGRRTGRYHGQDRRRYLFRHLNQKFVVENVGGAGGTIGALRAARAAADGYTILSGHLGTNALAPAFYPNLGYDPQKDFEPIGLSAEYPELLVVRKDFPANNLKEFVAYAKSNEGKLNPGHAGLGSVSYIGCLLLNTAIGIKPTMVPFTGTAPVLTAMLAGEIDYECDPVLGTLSQVRAGAVKALAVAARKRSPMLPDVPTSYEQGLPAFDCAPFYAVFAPSGTPQSVITKLADALNKGLSEEAVQKRFAELGADIVEPIAADRSPSPT